MLKNLQDIKRKNYKTQQTGANKGNILLKVSIFNALQCTYRAV